MSARPLPAAIAARRPVVDTKTLLATSARWVSSNISPAAWPCARRLEIDLDRGEIRILLSSRAGADEAGDVVPPDEQPNDADPLDFNPTPVQAEILLALRGCDMKADALARAVKVDKSRLFERGRGLDQLGAAGLVLHRDRVGYYLTEAGERLAELLASKQDRD